MGFDELYSAAKLDVVDLNEDENYAEEWYEIERSGPIDQRFNYYNYLLVVPNLLLLMVIKF